jgi:hypothetical protein
MTTPAVALKPAGGGGAALEDGEIEVITIEVGTLLAACEQPAASKTTTVIASQRIFTKRGVPVFIRTHH